jgi:ABC-2 type transport system permease protein
MAEGRTSDVKLVWDQIRYQNRSFWRTPIAAFFTIIFPLMFLFLFNTLFDFDPGVDEVSVAQFFAPSLAAFAAASATYTNIGVRVSMARDDGILKRVRGTPLPSRLYMAGVVGSAIWIAFVAVVIMILAGVAFYDLQIYAGTIAAATVAFIFGVTCFAALGLALAALSPTGDSAPAIANATLLPMAFISNVFLDTTDAPQWIKTLGDILPLKHFVVPLQDAFSPFTTDSAWRFGNLAMLVLWTIIGAVVAFRYFKWEPRSESAAGTRRSRRRREKAEAGV